MSQILFRCVSSKAAARWQRQTRSSRAWHACTLCLLLVFKLKNNTPNFILIPWSWVKLATLLQGRA